MHKKLECFAGPLDGSKVPFDMTAAGFIAQNPSDGEKHFYRIAKDQRNDAYYLHYCDSFGRMVAAARP